MRGSSMLLFSSKLCGATGAATRRTLLAMLFSAVQMAVPKFSRGMHDSNTRPVNSKDTVERQVLLLLISLNFEFF